MTREEETGQVLLDVVRFIANYDLGDRLMYSWSAHEWDGSKMVPCEPHYRVSVNCSDEFWWASADAEAITAENLPLFKSTLSEVLEIERTNEGSMATLDGPLLFVSRVREMRPMVAAMKEIELTLWPLFEACGPERDGEWVR